MYNLSATNKLQDAGTHLATLQVSKSWRAVATDERLWERHVRADTLCKNTLTHDGLATLGGWRHFYSSRHAPSPKEP